MWWKISTTFWETSLSGSPLKKGGLDNGSSWKREKNSFFFFIHHPKLMDALERMTYVFSVDGNKKKCLPKRCSLSSAEGMELVVERAQKKTMSPRIAWRKTKCQRQSFPWQERGRNRQKRAKGHNEENGRNENFSSFAENGVSFPNMPPFFFFFLRAKIRVCHRFFFLPQNTRQIISFVTKMLRKKQHKIPSAFPGGQ